MMSSKDTFFPSHEKILGSNDGTFGNPFHVEPLMTLPSKASTIIQPKKGHLLLKFPFPSWKMIIILSSFSQFYVIMCQLVISKM